MITPRVSWAFRRLLCGLEVNGEIDTADEPWRGRAAYLAGLPLKNRQAAWDAMMIGQPDRDEVISAMASVAPKGPPPADDDDATLEWAPIRFGTLPPVEPFPLDVLPLPSRDLAEAVAKSIGCRIDFPAMATLAVGSGLIGRTASLLIKPGYFESALLYLALVGSPSSGKSPALGAAMAPIWAIAALLDEIGRAAIETWNDADTKTRGRKPALTRIVSTDPTVEALGPILSQNPRGMILVKDEMSQWVTSMDQYKGGKGGDRQFYLSAWKGEPVYIDRAKNLGEPIVVPHPFLTVVGGLTPDMLTAFSESKGRDDGFLARDLFCFPDRKIRPYSGDGVPDDVAKQWDRLCQSLWARCMRELNGRMVPHVLKKSPAAEIAWADWVNAHRAEQDADDFLEAMEGPWGKLEAYAGRLSLVLHLMYLASDPDRKPSEDPPELARRIIDDAAKLIVYFKSHAARVYAALGGKVVTGGDDVRALVRWILRGDRAEFSTRDIGNNFHRFRDDPADLADALGWMTSHNLIRARPDPEASNSGKPGRKRAPTYEVNPLLRTTRRFLHFLQNTPRRPDSAGNEGNEGLS